MLSNGTLVDLGVLGPARVTDLIGQGGQGFVYRVQQASGRMLALKWYRPESASAEQRQGIRTLVDFGAPDHRYLWPLSMAEVAGVPGFGYVMELREPKYLELSRLLANRDAEGRELQVTFAATIAMCRQLAASFLRLHARGLCYRDISFGNVFFEPATGSILICDNDNVGVDNGQSRVLGTPFFMAPEVVADATFATLPNTDTDRHSLAVLLFYILFTGHPLEGRLTEGGLRDPAWLSEHFGAGALFCLHPERTENRPPAIVQQYWELYPTFLRELFGQAFVDGLHEPGARVTEGQWLKAMDRLADAMVRCACGSTGFFDDADPQRGCRTCGRSLAPALLLQVGRRRIAVSAMAQVRGDHLGIDSDRPTPIAAVRAHPQDPARWGLSNLTDQPWTARYAGNQQVTVAPGATVELTVGQRIDLAGGSVYVVRP
ncbi:hypothetical protein NODU109028_09035 [Nocardioides dubius]|uniref:Protein kinase domain-containing protein n=1 Tax=Nocardioides dubius TaxID=317019 RepID=A0ABP4EGE0_9ACTN